jgi:hypothetical protein
LLVVVREVRDELGLLLAQAELKEEPGRVVRMAAALESAERGTVSSSGCQLAEAIDRLNEAPGARRCRDSW